MEKKEFVCKYCNKKFPSGKSLGGHIRIHSHFDGNNNKKRSVDQREIQQQQQCRVCRKSFSSLKALANHMDCHSNESASETTTTTTSSGHLTMIKRSKKQHSSSDESLSIVSSSSGSRIVQGAKDLMFYHLGRKDYNLDVNSMVADSSEKNSELSSGELLLKTTDKVAVVDDDSDEGASDDDYFMNGPKMSDSDISVGGSLRNTGVGFGFNSFKNSGDELRNKEGGGSKHYELGKSKRVSPSNAEKIQRSSDDGMAKKARGANRNSKGHECPICFKVYSSGQALGGHKRSHTIANQQDRIKHKAAADMQIDLNLRAEDRDD